MKQALSYADIKRLFFDYCYEYCRTVIRANDCRALGQTQEEEFDENEFVYAYSKLKDLFEKPEDQLKLCVLALVLQAGRAVEEIFCTPKTLEFVLKRVDLGCLLANLAPEDADDLLFDLKLFQVIPIAQDKQITLLPPGRWIKGNKRTSYQDVRQCMFEFYHEYCRNKLMYKDTWRVGEYEVAYAFERCGLLLKYPIEKFMLEILTLTLAAGRLSDAETKNHWQSIHHIFRENGYREPSKLHGILYQEENIEFSKDWEYLYCMYHT